MGGACVNECIDAFKGEEPILKSLLIACIILLMDVLGRSLYTKE